MKNTLRLGLALGVLLAVMALSSVRSGRPTADAAARRPPDSLTAVLVPEGDRSTSTALAQLADTIVRTHSESHYTHHASIDASRGIYDVDCSSFVGHLLSQVAPEAYARVPRESRASRPRAFKYQQFFARLGYGEQVPGWSAVPRLIDARPGDVIAWSLLPLRPGKDTGHVMVLAAPPTAHEDGTVSVAVYDATGTPHAADTRAPGVTGVGRGTIRFRVDATGAPLAYQFAPGRRFQSHAIAIGRVSGG